MGKATYEDVHGVAELTERTKSNAFDFWHGIQCIEDSPAPAFHKPGICCPGFGLVFCRALALCSAGNLLTRRSVALTNGVRGLAL